MKARFWVRGSVAGLCWMLIFCSAVLGETGHYVNGVEGIKAATIPPPGFYYRMYNAYYKASTITNNDGNELDVGFDLNVYALVNRFIWVSGIKVLGADYVSDLIIPLIYTHVQIDLAGLDDSEFGLGDICFEPFVLSWHGARYDAAFGLGLYMPTGKYDQNDPASPGKDMWTIMTTLGSTWYLDPEKTWSASILARYEIHTDKRDTDVRPGNDFHFEWGIGKTFAKVFDVGVAGYCQWQVTDDSGPGTNDTRDRVYAIGPELNYVMPPAGLILNFRSLWEFEATDRSEGVISTLTLTKFF